MSINLDDLEDIIDSRFSLFFTRLVIFKYFNNKWKKEKTIQYLHDLNEYAADILQSIAANEGETQDQDLK